MSVGISRLPDCPRCDAIVEKLVHIAPGIAASKPCGCVFAPGEFFPDTVLEAAYQRELVTDGGVTTVDRPPLGPCDGCGCIRRCQPVGDGRCACEECHSTEGRR